ncbi:hypothetical protein B0H15DRAFT_954732 [Mycena belliarum]|uniref:Uncharacterized protein n=1 Tax=Mycena belliarum TaxID=1033014 RepID=A0AAD6TSY2_9AGAR|nr:hypothetical protein B0H15DRAFT_954732 [Mycena belliae]
MALECILRLPGALPLHAPRPPARAPHARRDSPRDPPPEPRPARAPLSLCSAALKVAAYALKSHCLTLHTGDVHALDAGAALINAYWMLVGDAWPAAPLSSTYLPLLPATLRPLPADADATAGGGNAV